MQYPTIHLKGTSRERLIEGWSEAYGAIQTALEKLSDCAPKWRDYYPQGSGALEKATDEHFDRRKRLASVMREIEDLIEKTEAQP